jgi:hypothetical protein
MISACGWSEVATSGFRIRVTVLHFVSSYATLCFVGILAELLLLESRFSLKCCTFALDNANALQQVCTNVGCTTSQGCITFAPLHIGSLTVLTQASTGWPINDTVVL